MAQIKFSDKRIQIQFFLLREYFFKMLIKTLKKYLTFKKTC